MAGIGALRRIFEAVKSGYQPVDEARAVGELFAARNPATYFETYKTPALSAEEAERIYGVKISPNRMSNVEGFKAEMRGSEPAFVFRQSPEDLIKEMADVAPGTEAVVRSLPRDKLYEIDTQDLTAGSGAGGKIYPALYDVLSGERGLYNIPTNLTAINARRRSYNLADALMRNPKTEEFLVPLDMQLLGISPEDYMGMSRPEKLGSLLVSAAAKQRRMLDTTPQTHTAVPKAIQAAAMAEKLGPMSSRQAYEDLIRATGGNLTGRGIGSGALRKMNIIEAILSGQKINPDLWQGLSRKKGGLMRYRDRY